MRNIINKIIDKIKHKKVKGFPEREDLYLKTLGNYKNKFSENGYDLSVKNCSVCIDGNDLKIIGKSMNTFWTAEGVLCDHDYDFLSNGKYIMIDIGLNIGITTLHMSKNPNIIKIYGYEPFVPTFLEAENNLKINQELSKKIKIFNFGLGGKDEALNINYNEELPGSMSSVVNLFQKNTNIQKIEIKKSSQIIGEIIKRHEELVFLKIDCEGAEHDIIEDLDSSNLLSKVNVIIMEWHLRSPQKMIEILIKNDFVLFNKDLVKDKIGIIRAVKNKPM